MEKLSGAGFPEELLWQQLWGLAFLKKARGARTLQWYALPGTAPHTLRRFPRRMRNLAKEIESMDAKIRTHQVYGLIIQFLPSLLASAIPGAQIDLRIGGDVVTDVGKGIRSLPVDRARDLLHKHAEFPKLSELPKLLRFYADYIEAVAKLTAHHAPKAPRFLKAMMQLEVIKVAKTLTGKFHANEIATLLEAAYSAIGVPEVVDPRNLKMQYSRRTFHKK